MNAPERVLLGFAAALREAGVGVTPDRAQSYLAAVALVGLDDRQATYAAGRATLCASREDLTRYDEVFAGWFGEPWAWSGERSLAREHRRVLVMSSTGESDEGAGDGAEAAGAALRATASRHEVLRHRDVASLSDDERARLAALFAQLPARAPLRRTARSEPWRRGRLDGSRTLRASLRRAGEPAPIAWRRRGSKPRRVVLLVDVSGSMSGYAEALLRLAHRLVQGVSTGSTTRRGSTSGRVEVFTLGTRLTRVSESMQLRDSDRALVAAGATVPDWAGGTRLGETLCAFLLRRRDLARGAVVVLFSDGWERGDAVLLGEQVAALHRLAHRLIWVNPHRGKPGYEPVQQGIVAVLPHVDDFLAGHTMATYAELMEVIARA
jgi:uncharacterized protein with von Willebrand factor type A (vWA) domain